MSSKKCFKCSLRIDLRVHSPRTRSFWKAGFFLKKFKQHIKFLFLSALPFVSVPVSVPVWKHTMVYLFSSFFTYFFFFKYLKESYLETVFLCFIVQIFSSYSSVCDSLCSWLRFFWLSKTWLSSSWAIRAVTLTVTLCLSDFSWPLGTMSPFTALEHSSTLPQPSVSDREQRKRKKQVTESGGRERAKRIHVCAKVKMQEES